MRVVEVNGLVVFAKGIAGSLVFTSGALIGRASIIGTSITGASIIRALIISALIRRASIASIVNSNIARKHLNSTSPLVNSR